MNDQPTNAFSVWSDQTNYKAKARDFGKKGVKVHI